MNLMTERNNNRKRNTTFAGKIYDSDFDTSSPTWPGFIAGRIANDMKFDNTCYQDAKSRDFKQKKEKK